MKGNLRELVDDKTIALVGNAKSIFKMKYGEEIDNHDIVVRFNKGYPTKPEAQGKRTDILSIAYLAKDEEILKFKSKLIIYRKKVFKKTNIDGMIYNMFRYRELEKLLAKGEGANRNQKRPSSGYMMIDLLLCLTKCKKPIDIYGFDWGATKTFYNSDDYITPHNYTREKILIKKLEEKGYVSIK